MWRIQGGVLAPRNIQRIRLNGFQPSSLLSGTVNVSTNDGDDITLPTAGRRHAPANSVARATQCLGMYAEMSKWRLSSFVVVTAGAGYAAGMGVEGLEPGMLAAVALCTGTGLAAGAANSWNQIIEGSRDAKMKRTRARPIPSGRITYPHAIGWGIFSSVSSVAILTAGTNPVTAALGLSNIALYSIPYTLSKPHTEWNTWTGALVGAIPPVMGWTAAGGSALDPESLILASTLFLWQFPHFFSLAWVHRNDYSRGDYQMVPVNDPGGERTARLVVGYALAMMPLPILAYATDTTSVMFAIEGVAMTSYWTYLGLEFQKERTNENARKVFKCSLWYLPLILGLFLFHQKKRKLEDNYPLQRMKELGRSLCIHDIIVENQDTKADGAPTLCPSTPALDSPTPSSLK